MKPLVLAVDTTHEYGSLALARGGELLHERLLHSPDGFAHVIYGELEALLRQCGVAPAEIDCFASASGPGSFTGVRVGLACIKGLAEALGKPAAAVSNLEAMARFGTTELRAPVLDARRGEIYGAVYDDAGALVSPEIVAPLPLWLETLPADVEFISLPDWRPALETTVFANARVTCAPRSLAPAIARIAAARFERGEARDPAALDANYIRRSDAELFWKE